MDLEEIFAGDRVQHK
jgi:hypothetical protein